jgi:hypothetical protein
MGKRIVCTCVDISLKSHEDPFILHLKKEGVSGFSHPRFNPEKSFLRFP